MGLKCKGRDEGGEQNGWLLSYVRAQSVDSEAVINLTEQGQAWPLFTGALYAHLISRRDCFLGPNYTFSRRSHSVYLQCGYIQ